VNILQAIVLGLVEGVTEYLPISSTFHLIWTAKLLGLGQTDFQKAFEVIIQGGSILAVVILYLSTLLKNKQLLFKVVASFLPTAVIGLIIYKLIKHFFFENLFLQLAVFIGVGLLFVIYEKLRRSEKTTKLLEELTYKDAVVIGLVQALAVVPGVSRAGVVMLGLMFLGVKREEAAKYSFMLAIPTLLAASGLDLVKSLPILKNNLHEVGLLAVGFITAFISALVVVKWFISYLQKHSLSSFGWYRIVLGAIFLILIFTKVL